MIKMSFILYLFLINSLFAEPLKFESGVKRNTLVELYTSEGCSSCPPAEEYLNKFTSNKMLWKTWVPIALHVDYWDYIGWRDQYATEGFGQRQSRYASLSRASTVYTPAFRVNGVSWRRGIFSRSLKKDKSSAGNLIVVVDGKSINATYKAEKQERTKLKLNVAILGMNMVSKIERGENEGRTARHEFVAVGFGSKVSSNSRWQMKLPALHYTKAKKYAVAIWVSKEGDPTPIQVVGGDLPRYSQ